MSKIISIESLTQEPELDEEFQQIADVLRILLVSPDNGQEPQAPNSAEAKEQKSFSDSDLSAA